MTPPGWVPPAHARSRTDEQNARVAEAFDAIDAATDDPGLRIELRRICWREGFCNRDHHVGIHRRDSQSAMWASGAAWHRSHDRGDLNPDACEAHRLEGDEDGAQAWAPRGMFGQSPVWTVAAAWRQGECIGPWAHDDPYEAARLVVMRIQDLCDRKGYCTCEERTSVWAGVGRWKDRTHLHRMRSIERQCGEQPSEAWALAVFHDTASAMAAPIREQFHRFCRDLVRLLGYATQDR